MASIAAEGKTEADSDPLHLRAAEVLAEKPCIDAAVKNFLATQLAESQARQQKLPSGAHSGTIEAMLSNIEPLDRLNIQRFCGAILRNVNAKTLLPPPQWSLEVPQGEDQTGLDRMQQVAEYKVLYAVWSSVKKKSEKVTKKLGISVLKIMWKEVRETTINECESKQLGTKEQILESLRLFESSFLEDEEKGQSKDPDMEELVWAVNFQATLHERNEKRKKQAEKREEEIKETPNIDSETGAATDKCTIEELNDEPEQEG